MDRWMDILYRCTGRDTVHTIRQVETHTDCHITMDMHAVRWVHT